MRLQYLSGIFLLATMLFAMSCDDEETYSPRTGEIISEVTTGNANVTAVSAEVTGTVKDLSLVSPSFYEVGVYYGTTEDPTTSGSKKTGSVDEDGNVITSLSGLTTGTTYYYAVYVTLKNKVTKFGEIKSFVATNVQVVTKDAESISSSKATFSSDITGTEGVETLETGVKLALSADGVSSGVRRELSTVEGLLPGTTYYYAAFAKVGDGYVYGETKQLTTENQSMEYVDLGLSIMWATHNIGAEKESEAGSLIGYGDPTGMKISTKLDDYPSSNIAGTIQDIVFNLDIDANSPMKSKMPTLAEISELIEKTTQEWTTVDGVEGMRFTASNGNSIFLPGAGYRDGENIVADGAGYYWSGEVSSIQNDYANTVTFNSSNVKTGFSKRHLGLSVRPVRPYAEIGTEKGKIIYGDIEGNGRIRIEIYNEYGETKQNPPIDPSSIKFSKNMVVTFTLTGITGNLKEGAAGSYVGGLQYADGAWGVQYWSGFEKTIYDAVITGDGTYTVWMETATPANGIMVFCVDINGLAADIVDLEKVDVEVNTIKMDADVLQEVNHSIVNFSNKDGDGVNGRIEIYNEYGSSGSAAQGYYNSRLNFSGLMLVDFTIDGIDGNLAESASKNYSAKLSFADADWNPQYWGEADYGHAVVTGDGNYQVYTYLPVNCEGAVVWTIELYDLWKDLVDPSKVSVTINKVVTPGKM